MNRRDFAKCLGTGLLGCLIAPRMTRANTPREVAITMDDFGLGADAGLAEQRTRAILSAFRAHSIRSAIFVTGKNVDSDLGQRLLKLWNDDGHMICNHTYSHHDYASSLFAEYTADVLRCEALIKNHKQFRKLFRFPYLNEGTTAEQRDRMRAWLTDHGYRNGAVTIDASDWYIDERLQKRLDIKRDADTSGYRNYYLQHILDRSNYYEDLAVRTIGRRIKHTLLIHHNTLNALYLGDILDQYTRLGWTLIDAEEAYTDPLFKLQPSTLPAGDSLVLALAIQKGKIQNSRNPPEDGVYEAPLMDRLGL